MPTLDERRKHDVAAALGKARALLEECQIRGIPVDLFRLARKVGIQRVTQAQTLLDGQLVELPGGSYEVILSRSAPVTRQRFTLAHEIAHLLLFPHNAGCNQARESEELCNVAASELLIPARFLTQVLAADSSGALQSLLKVTRLFRCSLEAAGWKILNSGLISGALLIWKIAAEQAGEFLELVAVPHTWGAERVMDQSLRVYPGDWLWQTVMAAANGPICFPSLVQGMCYEGEFIRLRKVVLIFVAGQMQYLRDQGAGEVTPRPALAGAEKIQPSASKG
ncbi:MAG TPA: ImmA/IrrE family metallo-endopeptidase [Candidatus Acidoferrales bacterium]|nr:ImmA/IrrE family metallo-endopeptidase [Candidatus Acidoferrales bacterium]